MTNYKNAESFLNHAEKTWKSLDKKPIPSDIHLSRKWINLLFLRLEGIFGSSWSQRHVSKEAWDVAKDEWAKSLGKYASKLEIIKHALDLMLSQNRSFPPNLPEFLDLCRQCEPQKQSSGFHEASEDFIKRYNEWDHKPACYSNIKEQSHGSEISRDNARGNDLHKDKEPLL